MVSHTPPAPPPGPLAALHGHPGLAAVGVLAVIGVFAMWRSGQRKAKRAAAQARQATRAVSLAGRMLLMAAVIVGGQWLIWSAHTSTTARLLVLGLPALFAAHTLTHAVTITGQATRHGGARR